DGGRSEAGPAIRAARSPPPDRRSPAALRRGWADEVPPQHVSKPRAAASGTPREREAGRPRPGQASPLSGPAAGLPRLGFGALPGRPMLEDADGLQEVDRALELRVLLDVRHRVRRHRRRLVLRLLVA